MPETVAELCDIQMALDAHDRERVVLLARRDRLLVKARRDGVTWAVLQAATGLSPRGLAKALQRTADGADGDVAADHPDLYGA